MKCVTAQSRGWFPNSEVIVRLRDDGDGGDVYLSSVVVALPEQVGV